MATKKINLKKFESREMSADESQGVKGGYKLSIGGTGSTGFINWDDIDIRDEDYKVIFGFEIRPALRRKTFRF